MQRTGLLLKYAPNDVVDWREYGKTVVYDTHALRTLTKTARKPTSKPPSANSRSTSWRSWVRCLLS